MTGVLVDSDILIEVLRGCNAELARVWASAVAAGVPLCYSPVTLAEIRHGMREPEKESTERVFSSMIGVPIAVEIGARAGDYLRRFSSSHSVELGDALIAATASVHHLQLWTLNRKHFPMKDLEFFTKSQKTRPPQ
jgi:predicted nucleic acid-binding protein